MGNVKKNVENAESAVDQLASKIPAAKVNNDDKKPDFEAYIDLVKFIEEYRWLGTVCFYTWTALVGLLLIGGKDCLPKCLVGRYSVSILCEPYVCSLKRKIRGFACSRGGAACAVGCAESV